MPINYWHQSALLGKLLHHHTPEMSTACVNSGLLRVCQKDMGRNPQRSQRITWGSRWSKGSRYCRGLGNYHVSQWLEHKLWVWILAPPLIELSKLFHLSMAQFFHLQNGFKSSQPLKVSVRLEEGNTRFRRVPDSHELSIVGLLAHMVPLWQLEKDVPFLKLFTSMSENHHILLVH